METRNLILLFMLLFMAGCSLNPNLRNFGFSPIDEIGGDSLLMDLTVQYPELNRRVGWMIPRIYGKCPLASLPVFIHFGSNLIGQTTCSANGTWSTHVDVSGLPIGFHVVEISQLNTTIQSVTSYSFQKVHSDCDLLSNRDSAFLTGGSGLEASSPKIVCTRNQLPMIAEGEGLYFRLGNDVDFQENPSQPHLPLRMKNSFDGNGFSLANLSINQEDEVDVGFFSKVQNTSGGKIFIKRIRMENPDVRGFENVGALIGRVIPSDDSPVMIESIQVENGLVNGDQHIGGIVGSAGGGALERVRFSGQVEGREGIGGIIGFATNTHINEASNLGTVLGVKGSKGVGGVVGHILITNSGHEFGNTECRSNVVRASGTAIGGLIGFLEGQALDIGPSLVNCQVLQLTPAQSTHIGPVLGQLKSVETVSFSEAIYNLVLPVMEFSGLPDPNANSLGVGLSGSQFFDEGSFPKDFDFNFIWSMSLEQHHPTLRWSMADWF